MLKKIIDFLIEPFRIRQYKKACLEIYDIIYSVFEKTDFSKLPDQDFYSHPKSYINARNDDIIVVLYFEELTEPHSKEFSEIISKLRYFTKEPVIGLRFVATYNENNKPYYAPTEEYVLSRNISFSLCVIISRLDGKYRSGSDKTFWLTPDITLVKPRAAIDKDELKKFRSLEKEIVSCFHYWRDIKREDALLEKFIRIRTGKTV